MSPNNAVEVYAPDSGVFGDEYLAEKLETKAGGIFRTPMMTGKGDTPRSSRISLRRFSKIGNPFRVWIWPKKS